MLIKSLDWTVCVCVCVCVCVEDEYKALNQINTAIKPYAYTP